MRWVSVTIPVTLLAAENEPIFNGRACVACELVRPGSRRRCVRPASSRNDDDVGDRFPPGQLVGMMLERPDEHHGAFLGGDGVAQVVTVVQCGRDPQPEDADQFVDRTGAARSREDHDGFGIAADSVVDNGTGVLAQPGGLQTGSAGLGVRVGVAGQYLVADEVLEEAQRSTRRGVVGIGHPARPVRTGHHLILADHRVTDPP